MTRRLGVVFRDFLTYLVDDDIFSRAGGILVKSNSLSFLALALALGAPADGWAWTQAASSDVVFSRCGHGSHTEAYPRAIHRKRAYGCKSDEAGYLEGRGQNDEPGN